MSGLIYKNFRINFSSFILAVGLAVLCGISNILISVFVADSLEIEESTVSNGAVLLTVIFALVYYFTFILQSFTNSYVFEADENRTACAFSMSNPQSGKGHVEAKYWYILIRDLTILFICFLFDSVCSCITGISTAPVIMLIFCFRMLITAIEIPFLIRCGAQKGFSIKGIVIMCIAVLVILYFVFGDISWLISGDDLLTAFANWVRSGKIMILVGLFPFVCTAAYYISCRISVKLFRKGAENYEQ